MEMGRGNKIIVSESSNMEKLVYDSGVQENYHENQMLVSFDLKPRTRYYWQVEVKDDKGDCAKSNPAWFETGKLQESWTAKWIGTEENEKRMPLLYKEFELKEKPESVRCMYVVWDYMKHMSMKRRRAENFLCRVIIAMTAF